MSVLASLLRRAPLFATAAAVAILASSCIYTSDAPLVPPPTAFYFPTGLVVSPGGTTLYVVNSDFDLQYNGGTVQALSLAQLRPDLLKLTKAFREGQNATEACASVGVRPNGECELSPPFICTNDILNPGPCSPIVGSLDNPLVKNFVTIGAFASGAIYVADSDPGAHRARLFLPVRGDPSITFLDVDDDRDPTQIAHPCSGDFCLDCAATGKDRRCANSHKLGEDPFENTRDLTIPTEPVGIAATEDGLALVAAHDTDQALSLSSNTWKAGSKPTLQFVLGALPTGPTEVVTVPVPAYAKAAQKKGLPFDYQPGFLVTYRGSPSLDLIRYTSDATSMPPRPFLTKVFQTAITTQQDGKDSRGIAIDSSARKTCEAKCGDRVSNCLLECTKIPMGLFVANRAPAALIVGEVRTTLTVSDDQGSTTATGATDEAFLTDTMPLDTGPSHVAVAQVIDRDGKLVTRVFTVCFDTRTVFMYDPKDYRVDAVIHTGRGPQSMAFDTSADGDHSFLIVGHFTDSYLGVVDLDMRNPTFGTMFATIGEPLPPRESK